jgi:Secretion system C-terminal sorting domain
MKIHKLVFMIFPLVHLAAFGQKILPNFWNYEKDQESKKLYAQHPTIGIEGQRNTDIEVQSIEISTYSTLPNMEGITLHFMVYPNPFKEFLILKVEGDDPSKYMATIFDTNGKDLITEKVSGDETTFLTNNLVPAVYLLKVIQLDDNSPRKILKVFKVIKK